MRHLIISRNVTSLYLRFMLQTKVTTAEYRAFGRVNLNTVTGAKQAFLVLTKPDLDRHFQEPQESALVRDKDRVFRTARLGANQGLAV